MSNNSINQVGIKKLDGTYETRDIGVNYSNVNGLSEIVPIPTAYDSYKFLKGDGTWSKLEETKTVTLAAGNTRVTFTNLPTSGNHTFDIYTNKVNLDYENLDDSVSGSLTVEFEAQTSAVEVYLIIREVN